MRNLLSLAALMLALSTNAAERKSVLDVDINALTGESQSMVSTNNSFDLVWWVIPEFWEATFRQSPDVSDAQADQLLSILRNHTVLAVVQADISPLGSFRFFDKDAVMKGLQVEAISADGKARTVSHTEAADPDLRLMLDQMRPVLAQAMGNMGENLYFFPLPAFDGEGEEFLSPYEFGRLRVSLGRETIGPVLEIETPLDALYVPRTCPNGKPAHVSWTYCPWSGERLPQ